MRGVDAKRRRRWVQRLRGPSSVLLRKPPSPPRTRREMIATPAHARVAPNKLSNKDRLTLTGHKEVWAPNAPVVAVKALERSEIHVCRLPAARFCSYRPFVAGTVVVDHGPA